MFPKRFALCVISSLALVVLPSTAVVADPGDDVMEWTLLGESMSVDEANAQWGTAVALNEDGTIMATGAPTAVIDGNLDQGRVAVYRFVDGTWSALGGVLDGPGPDSFFGQSVALSSTGLALAVGAQGSGLTQGRVQVFDSTPTGWERRGGPIIAPGTGELFGRAVALSADGSTVVIGAPVDSVGGVRSGAVSVWKWAGGVWGQVGASILGAPGDQLGASVAISAEGTIIATGGPSHLSNTGIVRLYASDGATWTPLGRAPIVGNGTGDYAGESVSLDAKGHTVAVGAPFSKKPGQTSRGSVEVFDLSDGNWLKRGDTLYAVATGNRFGSSVSLDGTGTRLSIGAPRNGDAGPRAGHARVYHFDSDGWQLLGEALLGSSAGDEAGTATAISADGLRVAVGSPLRALPSVRSGEVRVFQYPVLRTEEESESEEQVFKRNAGGLPGIHLHLVGSPGRLVTQTSVHFGAYRVAPNSRYVLSVTAVGASTTTASRILAQGVVNRGGHLGGSIRLHSLAPGDYTVTLSGSHAGGTGLRLTAPFSVGSAGEIRWVSPNIPGIW